MRFKSNLHTHTMYCDGSNTVEEMVAAAALKGYESIGFCEHAFVDFDEDFSMSVNTTKKYINEVNSIKNAFDGFLDIFLGCEYDYYSSNTNLSNFDFVVGGVHYAQVNDGFICFDETEGAIVRNVKNYFNGDFYAYCKQYYRLVCELADKVDFDVMTHFDLVTKFNFDDKYFDESDERYLFPAIEAAEHLIKKSVVFEIDTGGMCKKCKKNPYTDMMILSAIKNFGGRVTIASDAHSVKELGFNFDVAMNLAGECGFKTIQQFTKSGFKEFSLINKYYL